MKLNEQISRMKSMMGLIKENVLESEKFLEKKDQLFNYLWSIGMDKDNDYDYADINKDGINDTLITSFNLGNVVVFVGICGFSNGEIKYHLYIKTSNNDEVVLDHTFYSSVEEVKENVEKVIKQNYEDTKLDYLGVSEPNEYQPSKEEYNDLLNKAIDDENWDEASRLQKKYEHLYN